MLRTFLFNLFIFFISANSLFGQTVQITVDSTFEAYIDSAWADIQKSDYSDSLQKKYASEFFQYYLNHSETETGFAAGRSAFMMWGNIGAAENVDAAMARLDNDSEIWNGIINSIGNAYYRSKRGQEYTNLLIELSDNLTHPKSKSRVLLRLAGIYHGDKKFEKVKKLAHEIIKLDAHKFHTGQAKGLLYEIENLSIGKKAPDFKAKTIEGKTISRSDLRGKVVLLDFWAMWCGPCIPEIPHIKSIDSTHTEEELQIIGISLDENIEELRQFVKEKGMKWPHIIQTESWKDEITKLYNISGIPQTYIIDRSGYIVAKDLRGEELEKKIAELVNKSENTD